jgi:hypothetical protein
MQAILTMEEEFDAWLTASIDEALRFQLDFRSCAQHSGEGTEKDIPAEATWAK